jgi:hypothetical protein
VRSAIVRPLVAPSLAALGALASPVAYADEAPTALEMDASMRSYFAAEKTEGWLFVGLGSASIGLGAYLLTRSEDLAHGIAYPVMAIGALQAIAVGAYAFGINSTVEHLSSELAHDPRTYREEELARMTGVTRRFVLYRIVELVVLATGAGFVTAGFVRSNDAFKGVGVGLASQASILLTLDFFADARAHAYRDQIDRFSPSITASPGIGASPWMIGVQTSF